jgi:hypothetical protein
LLGGKFDLSTEHQKLIENRGFERKSGPMNAEHYVSAGVHFEWAMGNLT